ncbi:26S proteasome regulatory subunit 6A-like [Haemaphysalis longicornis]
MADIPALVSNTDAPFGEDVSKMSTEEVICKTKWPDDQVKLIRSEIVRIPHVIHARKQKIWENHDKIKANMTLRYLVSSIVELLEVDPLERGEKDGASASIESKRKGGGAVIKSSTRQTSSSPFVALVHDDKLRPGLGTDSFVTLQTLPQEYDSRAEVIQENEMPLGQYCIIGDLDKQTQELVEANKSTFLKPEGTPLGQMSIGDGAKMVRDAFAPVKQRAPAIILTGGIDDIGNERFDSEKAGDREVQCTMLELISLLDGLSSSAGISERGNTRLEVLARPC